MTIFDHEKLKVYQQSIVFNSWGSDILSEISSATEIRRQMEKAMISIPLNLAEGNGKISRPDRCRFFEIAMGSTLECAACLDLLVAKKIMTKDKTQAGKEMLGEIVAMMVGLIRVNDPLRLEKWKEK